MTRADWPPVAVVVLNWNDYAGTADCLASLAALDYPDYRVVVVDNGSTDGSGDRLAADFEWCDVVETGANLGFGGGCNAGIERALDAGAAHVVLLNNDATVAAGFLRELVAVAAESDGDVVGALVRDGDGAAVNGTPNRFPDMFFYSGYRSNLPLVGGESADDAAGADAGEAGDAGNAGDAGDAGSPAAGPTVDGGRRWWETDRVEGAAVLLPRRLLRERRETVGYYLDDSLFMYCEEVELAAWCRRRGLTSVVAGDAVAHHDGEASSSRPFQLYYLTRNRVLVAHRYFGAAARVAFDLLYAPSRLALAGRHLRRGDREAARAILAGLLDGYRGIDGKRRDPG